MQYEIDYTPLTERIGIIKKLKIATNFPEDDKEKKKMIVALILFAPIWLVILLIILFLIFSPILLFVADPSPASLFINTVIIFIIYIIYKGTPRGRLTKEYRYKKFAETNNIDQPHERQPGMIFKNARHSFDLPRLRFNNKPQTNIGNFYWRYGKSDNIVTTRRSQGYLSINISRNLPHVVLDSKSNDLFSLVSNMHSTFHSYQKLSLEGNFDKYFTLYCPVNYERDTLYWMNPELMHILITHFSSYDIEVVDNYIYLYPNGTFEFTPQNISNLIKLSEWMYDVFERNTRLYRDEQIGSFTPNVIATPGKRLSQPIKITLSITLLGILYFLISLVFAQFN